MLAGGGVRSEGGPAGGADVRHTCGPAGERDRAWSDLGEGDGGMVTRRVTRGFDMLGGTC